MNKFLLMAALGFGAAAVTAPASAQVNHRQWEQQHRIQQGARSGELTRGEYQRLERQQARINRTEQRMRWRNGGRLSPDQRARLEQRQDRASANIYRQKHDRQDRPYRR